MFVHLNFFFPKTSGQKHQFEFSHSHSNKVYFIYSHGMCIFTIHPKIAIFSRNKYALNRIDPTFFFFGKLYIYKNEMITMTGCRTHNRGKNSGICSLGPRTTGKDLQIQISNNKPSILFEFKDHSHNLAMFTLIYI